jgi:hypothetical protein
MYTHLKNNVLQNILLYPILQIPLKALVNQHKDLNALLRMTQLGAVPWQEVQKGKTNLKVLCQIKHKSLYLLRSTLSIRLMAFNHMICPSISGRRDGVNLQQMLD